MKGVKIVKIFKKKIDFVIFDIIEGVFKNVCYEMDVVFFCMVMSFVICEQYDEFLMIIDLQGCMVVGQFGLYIFEMMDEYDDVIEEGDVILMLDFYKCGGVISYVNDWFICVLIFFEGEFVGWLSQFGYQMDVGGFLFGVLLIGVKMIFGEGLCILLVKVFKCGEFVNDVIDLIFNNVCMFEMNCVDLLVIIVGCCIVEKCVYEIC